MGDLLRRESQAVHAGIDLEPDRDRLGQLAALERAQLAIVVHDDGKTVAGYLGQFGDIEETFEQHDGMGDAGFAQGNGFFQAGNAEGIGLMQGFGAADQAVAIAVGLDHRQHPGRRRSLACTLKIRSQGLDVYRGPRRTRHAYSPR